LSLCIIAGPGRGEPEPRIELPPNDTLEVLDPAVVLSDASILVSGRVKRLLPWADTSWDYVVISLYDENGELIIEINTDYSPRPVPHPYRSAYEPSSRFAVKIKGVTRRVHSVRITCHPGSVSHLRPGEGE
jgi:hypothetical protein